MARLDAASESNKGVNDMPKNAKQTSKRAANAASVFVNLWLVGSSTVMFRI